jgi:hypothetical protein
MSEASTGRSGRIAAAAWWPSPQIVGILVVVALVRYERDQQVSRAARDIRVGDDSASVLAVLGVPQARCPTGALPHLRGALPPGTPQSVLERLRGGTASRWVWGDGGCDPGSGDTEVGFTGEGRVYWAIPAHGDGAATLP